MGVGGPGGACYSLEQPCARFLDDGDTVKPPSRAIRHVSAPFALSVLSSPVFLLHFKARDLVVK